MLRNTLRSFRVWKNIERGASDPILGLRENYIKDKHRKKSDLSVGVYRDNSGNAWVPEAVQKARNQVINQAYEDNIAGPDEFINSSLKLALGDSQAIEENRIVNVQTPGAAGALHTLFNFIKHYLPQTPGVYFPVPSSFTHKLIAHELKFPIHNYTYYDPDKNKVKISEMLRDLEMAKNKSVVVLQVCGHDPTGLDFSKEDWSLIQDITARKQHLALFVMEQQGLVSGDPTEDSYPVRLFAEEGNPFALAQSFSVNFGLYGERVGSLTMNCGSGTEAEKLRSILVGMLDYIWGGNALFGARVVEKVLGTPELKREWETEVAEVAKSLLDRRNMLVDHLRYSGSLHNWSHLKHQKGLFSYTGMRPKHVLQANKSHSVYLTLDGRINIGGINSNNVFHVAESIDEATRFTDSL